jgi:hypothetical protein
MKFDGLKLSLLSNPMKEGMEDGDQIEIEFAK